ncbi:MAG: hypothetical protein J5517_05770 [Eubacterium sp.]|nr:hypothetical protein [Eubacterium sp.]
MKGMTVQLAVKTLTGTDAFGAPIYSEELVNIDDVLVGQPSSNDVITTLELTGKRIAYTLGIPKGDTHNWVDTDVIFFGERFRTIGIPMTGIQENIPLRWGSNIQVERYG